MNINHFFAQEGDSFRILCAKKKVTAKVNFLVLFVLIFFLAGCTAPDPNQLALCLKEKSVVMYGASWCPHCTEQKELFGQAFANLTYVECANEQQKCAEAGIEYLPTWKFPNGTEEAGILNLKELAEKSGCD